MIDARFIVYCDRTIEAYEAVVEAARAEHRYVETVDAEGDDWLGCLCGLSACPILHALLALDTAKEAGR